MELAIFWTGIAIACSIVATNKGRSGIGWFFLGLMFSLVSLLIVLVLPAVKPEQDDGEHTKCPHCAEYIKREAIKCKHCGEAVTPNTMATTPAPDPSEAKAERIGAQRAGKYWQFGGKTFETAAQVIEYAKRPG